MLPRPLIPAATIASRVGELGAELTRVYADRAPILLALMDGAFCFAADLSRAIAIPDLQLAFLRVRSYRGTASTGLVEMGTVPDLAGEDVLIVDDILDSGRTLAAVREAVVAAAAESVRVCVLLDKPMRRVASGLERADWTGFTVPDAFVVGYGLDLDGRWRHLPDVCIIDGLDPGTVPPAPM